MLSGTERAAGMGHWPPAVRWCGGTERTVGGRCGPQKPRPLPPGRRARPPMVPSAVALAPQPPHVGAQSVLWPPLSHRQFVEGSRGVNPGDGMHMARRRMAVQEPTPLVQSTELLPCCYRIEPNPSELTGRARPEKCEKSEIYVLRVRFRLGENCLSISCRRFDSYT